MRKLLIDDALKIHLSQFIIKGVIFMLFKNKQNIFYLWKKKKHIYARSYESVFQFLNNLSQKQFFYVIYQKFKTTRHGSLIAKPINKMMYRLIVESYLNLNVQFNVYL